MILHVINHNFQYYAYLNIIWTTIMNIMYLEHLEIVVNDIQNRG
jgi:hypothetical protein